MKWLIRITAMLSVLLALRATPEPRKNWYKGNLHTHTTNSDGDSPPEVVARWYKEHGYQFLVLSDHNVYTDPAPLNTALGEPGKYLLFGGEEVTDKFDSRPVHVNAYGVKKVIPPAHGDSLVSTIQRNVDAIRETGALPSLNHPNFGWAIQSSDLLVVENMRMFEVYNGHPTVFNRGGGGAESLEEMWDKLLTAGKRIHGVAVDDAHVFKSTRKDASNPGRGWVVVRAESLDGDKIVDALREGDFYSSTGVELEDVTASGTELRVAIKPRLNFKYTTEFIGAGGSLLAKSYERESSYRLKAGEPYVRAVIRASNGDDAWTQALTRR